MKLIMCKGLPGSGKSTWAKKLVQDDPSFVRVNRDDIRELMHCGKPWSKDQEKVTVKVRDAMIKAGFKAGKNVVCDDTNLDPRVQRELFKIAQAHRAGFDVKDFTDVPLETCIERDAAREQTVGIAVIRGMYDKFLRKPQENLFIDEVYAPPAPQDPTLPPCIIVDMDGTLAVMNGNRGPYEDHLSDTDDPHEFVVRLVESYTRANPEVKFFIMSGRDEGRARGATERWLTKHGFTPDAVYMRKAGDMRSDMIVKRELYEEYIQGKYYVQMCIDDRDSVVQLWRIDLGLPCCQVNYGDF
jgi:predicted kinase